MLYRLQSEMRIHLLEHSKGRRIKPLFLHAAVFLTALMTACGGAGSGAGAGASDGGHTLSSAAVSAPIGGTTAKFTVPTTMISGVTSYPAEVYLPADYATTTDLLPVIYMTDGIPDAGSADLAFEFADVCRILERQHLRAIVVGLTGQNRDTDYLMPGSASFYKFVTEELIPFVESRHRIDTTNRTLSGHSYGGLFAAFALAMARPGQHYFANFIIEDGAFWYRPDLIAAEERSLFTAHGGILPGIKVVLSSSALGNGAYVQDYYNDLLSLNFAGLNITYIAPYRTTHLEMFDEGFSASINAIFTAPPSSSAMPPG